MNKFDHEFLLHKSKDAWNMIHQAKLKQLWYIYFLVRVWYYCTLIKSVQPKKRYFNLPYDTRTRHPSAMLCMIILTIFVLCLCTLYFGIALIRWRKICIIVPDKFKLFPATEHVSCRLYAWLEIDIVDRDVDARQRYMIPIPKSMIVPNVNAIIIGEIIVIDSLETWMMILNANNVVNLSALIYYSIYYFY